MTDTTPSAPTPGRAAYTATVAQAITDGHGISEYPAWEHLEPWQRERWEIAAKAAIGAQPPAIIQFDGELSEADAARLREEIAEAVRTGHPRLVAGHSERVAELVGESNQLRGQIADLVAERSELHDAIRRIRLIANRPWSGDLAKDGD